MNSSVSLASIRAARETTQFLGSSDFSNETFVHKWSKQQCTYKGHHLNLPRSLALTGSVIDDQIPQIGVGGTRSPTVEAFCLVNRLVSRFDKFRFNLISGGVPGIDLATHLASMSLTNCWTYAVMANPVGCGLDGHEWGAPAISNMIAKQGGFLSEYAERAEIGSEDFRERLLQRDRLITGLSDVFLAFECSKDSATVDTAHRAILQGKKVFAIDSKGETWRDGLRQITSLPGVTSLSENTSSDEEIVDAIFTSLKN